MNALLECACFGFVASSGGGPGTIEHGYLTASSYSAVVNSTVIQCASVDIWAGTVNPLDELISLLNLAILHMENQGVAMENQGFNKTLIIDSLNGIKRGLVRVWCDAIEKSDELEGL